MSTLCQTIKDCKDWRLIVELNSVTSNFVYLVRYLLKVEEMFQAKMLQTIKTDRVTVKGTMTKSFVQKHTDQDVANF